MKFKFTKKEKIDALPQITGVYCFALNPPPQKKATTRQGEIFYIGKASNIKTRAKNHFSQPSFRDNLYINKVDNIGFIQTDSEVEALILESNLIKKYKPKYNVVWKDDKNYSFVAITPSTILRTSKEQFPRVFITHQTKNLKSEILKLKTDFIGPFVDGKSLKRTLGILRRIFPYYVSKKHSAVPCSWCHLGLCPGPNPDKKNYKRNIKHLVLFLKGGKQSILKKMKKEMETASRLQKFEKASEIRDQIVSLERIISNAKIFEKKSEKEIDWQETENKLKNILETKKPISRIECYDVSNIQGKMATGSMVVFINGRSAKNFYRKFKIKMKNEPNDIAMLKEILTRRFNHAEWNFPEVILIDGGKAQLNAAILVKTKNPNLKNIIVLAIAKRNNELYIEGKAKPLLLAKLPREIFNLILQLRDEAHRFAITYHRKLRESQMPR